MGTPPGSPNRTPPKRGEVTGWSTSAVRRHTKWLYSVGADDLAGVGYAVTLTLRDCPPSAVEWQRLRRAWIMRANRLGATRVHWVVEWQRRGVPHLHGVAYFDDADDHSESLLSAWLAVAASYGAERRAQHVDVISGPLGWLKYLSKHAARGVAHYQRQGKPAGWTKTGRLWGYSGEWPTGEPMRFDVDRAGGYRLRRLVRSWRVANARAALQQQIERPASDERLQAQRLRAARRRVKSARGMLRCSDPALSRVRGVSEWMGEAPMTALLWLLVGDGHAVAEHSEVVDERAGAARAEV